MNTTKATQAIFGRSNFYLAVGDQVNHLFSGLVLEDLAAQLQNPPRTLAMLYLITIFQYVETLPDHFVPDALRERVDWKYALHLPLNALQPGSLPLCEFRKMCLKERSDAQNFQMLLMRLSELSQSAGTQLLNLEIHQIIARVCMFSRLTKIWEAFNQALEAMATRRPDWLLANNLPHWYERYGHRGESLPLQAGNQEQEALAQTIGLDGTYLLKAISKSNLPALKGLPEVSALQQIWQEQFWQVEEEVLWRKAACAGCDFTAQICEPNKQHNLTH